MHRSAKASHVNLYETSYFRRITANGKDLPIFRVISINAHNTILILLTLLHSERSKLHRVLAVLSAIGLKALGALHCSKGRRKSDGSLLRKCSKLATDKKTSNKRD